MSGNIALDIVIGLVFVYLLYSMYATVLMEIIAASIGLRARNLSYTLRRMLMDERRYTNPEGTEENKFRKFWMRLWTSIVQFTGKAPNLSNDHLYRRFFEQPTIKYLCSGGFNNKPSYLKPENFSKALMDAIRIDDSELTALGSIQKGLLYNMAERVIPVETGRHIQSLLDEANNDLVKFRLLLERWFTDTMERSSGWYKRNVQIFLAVIGLVLAMTFNINTITIVKRLARDKDARDQLVNLAIGFTEENKGRIPEAVSSPSPADTSTVALKARVDSLYKIRQELLSDMEEAQNVLGSAWVVPNDLKEPEWWYKFKYVFTPSRFGGYFLTMLAISLGAPFWFDLLNKLISLRSAKQPTESTQSSSSTTSKETLNRVG